MEKKRRARINVSLEQLKCLLEKHYSHQIRKRKLEKADILELSVKYMKSMQSSLQGLWPAPGGAEYPPGFRGCLPGVSQLLRHGEEGNGLHCPLVLECTGGSTMDSAGPSSCPEALALHCPNGHSAWVAAPVPATGSPRSPPPRLLLASGPPGLSTSVSAPQPASRRRPDSPGPGLRVWRPCGKVAVGSGAEQTSRSEENRCPAPAHSAGRSRRVPTGTKRAGPRPAGEEPFPLAPPWTALRSQ
ncbi:transcription factor HES-3 [Orycteropus afer afer]|uniref:Transcription factor HES-3 n=1 Tax=Orycteropus afer afer TaxID=1230840 RepID=A0A8B6ZYJ3_ORYAF|nr:transcription factor HES-3 [Orycteropus afer afer]